MPIDLRHEARPLPSWLIFDIRPIMKLHIGLLFTLSLVSTAQADMKPPPFQKVAVSSNSEYFARVDSDSKTESGDQRFWISIHRYSSESRAYTKISEFQYGENPG